MLLGRHQLYEEERVNLNFGSFFLSFFLSPQSNLRNAPVIISTIVVDVCRYFVTPVLFWEDSRRFFLSGRKSQFLKWQLPTQASFRGGTRGNAVPIVEKLSGMAFTLLKVFKNAQERNAIPA